MKFIYFLSFFFLSYSSIGQQYHVIIDQQRTKLIDDIDLALAQAESIYQLNLSGKGYTGIPDVVESFPNLEYLDLSNNNIAYVDLNSLAKCPNLKFLYLDNNEIEAFPIEIFDELPYLEVLNLGFNRIQEIRFDMTGDRLVSLNLHHNKIGHISGQWFFKALEELRLDGNQLTNEGLELSLKAKIKAVNLHGNRFTKLPSILSEMNDLESLDLGKNKLSSLKGIKKLRKLKLLIVDNNPLTNPATSLETVLSLRKLKNLSFAENGVERLPIIPEKSRVEEMSLVGNRIESLPYEVKRAKKLKKLWMSGNPLNEKHIDLLSRKFDKTIIIF